MRLIYKNTIVVLLLVLSSLSLFAQNNFFSKADERSIVLGEAKRVINPERFNLVEANYQDLKNFLWSLPDEQDVTNRANAPIMELPMPNGTMARFRVWQSNIQEPALQAKFPEIKTFAGEGVDDPYANIRMDYSPYLGFHAQVLSINGRIFIDPYARGNIKYYQSYYTADNKRQDPYACGVIDEPATQNKGGAAAKVLAGPCRGTQLYTYRLAVACTGEYANAVGAGGNAAILHNAIVTTVNRVTQVYEYEVAIRLILIANNNQIEFTNPNTDPFNGNSNGNTLIGESQTQITNIIGTQNFDIGHTFSTGGGGLASPGVCNSNFKASGITGSPNPVGDAYDIDYVCHEMGHQFNAMHSFNSTAGNCGFGNRVANSAYEPGSGTTIMGYAGICSTDDIQPHSDPYFHPISFDQITTYIESGGTCHGTLATGNTIPQIIAMDNNNVTIPINTPFTLNGTATDGNGDAITYCWEEWDRGSAGTWNSGAGSTTAPLFKSRIPKTTGSRTFPDMAVILAGYPANPSGSMNGLKGETLPGVPRTMKFRLTVRDNRAAGGGVTSGGEGCQSGFTSTFAINVAGSGPFIVTSPNGGESYNGGSVQTVTWNNAGTDQAPFNTPNVKISFSNDGGQTFPIVLLASTPNDGSEAVTIPIGLTTTARIKVEGVNNVFFDISNNNFTVIEPLSTFIFEPTTPASVNCGGSSSANVTLPITSSAGFNTPVNLSASDNPPGTTVSFSTNPVTPGNSTIVTLNGMNTLPAGTYNITVTGSAASITKSTVVSFVVSPVTVTLAASTTNLTFGQTATLTATPQPAGNYTYLWTLNGSPIPGATGSTYIANAGGAGDYTVSVAGCSINPSDPVKITAIASNTLFIFPNPNNGKFNIAYYYSGSGNTLRYVTIFDARGALVYSKSVNISMPYQIIDVNMMSAASGSYLVVIRDTNGKKIAAGTVLIGNH